jgi:hypothetical protein
MGRLRSDAERVALRHGTVRVVPVRPLRIVVEDAAAASYCSGCAGPIEFGAVVRGLDSFCSVECSLEPGGDRPA